MRILHAPSNIAGQASTIADAQRRLGHDAKVLVFNKNVYGYNADIDLRIDARARGTRTLAKIWNFVRCVRRYDVFHFHYGRSLLPFNLDLRPLRLMGKTVVMEYWGSDVMQIDVALKYYSQTREELRRIFPKLDDEKQRKKIAKIEKLVDISIVGDYCLQPFSPQSIVVRQSLNLSELPYVGVDVDKTEISILHAPTNRTLKGTAIILSEIEKLRKRGFRIDLVLVEKMEHSEAIEVFKEVDIVVDDVLQGYGMLALECMALGKPVLGRIDPLFVQDWTDIPIMDTNPENLHNNLMQLITHPEMRREIGERGRKYVEKNHDSIAVAKKLIDIYERYGKL
jgi:glycosyltransferase involved in cell wall biosynthesis